LFWQELNTKLAINSKFNNDFGDQLAVYLKNISKVSSHNCCSMKNTIKIKRLYDAPEKSDGFTILVDRLWPRGMRKEDAFWDLWLKEVAPSSELRKWFNHEPEKWKAFKIAYEKELKDSAALKELIDLLRRHKIATFLYSTKEREHNHAVVLKEVVEGEG
jgi:uncharacterized protein YeaO (DUF488 family)